MRLKVVGRIKRESPRRKAIRLQRLFKLLSIVEGKVDLSQRYIADELNLSIGTTNYLLQEAVQKGWVRMEPIGSDPEQHGYNYSLTPKGEEKKSSMTEKFYSLKMEEYKDLKQEIQEIKLNKESSARGSKANPNKQTIAQLNDNLRRSFVGGRVVVTKGVSSLSDSIYDQAIQMVKNFNQFNKDNDPYDEHDMGMFKVEGESFMWKIDYYDESMQNASPDPSDSNVTRRVLTIMLSSEY